MLTWTLKHPKATMEHLGFIPHFIWESDPRPVKEQINDRYAHGGGWFGFKGFKMVDDGLVYPGDPKMVLIAEAKLRNETIRFYDGSWLAIVQEDGTFEISRLD